MKLAYELAVEHEGAELARYSVPPGEYVIGRADSSSISILVGPVSRKHARLIVGEDGTVQVEDLGSANGTHLDEQPLAVPTRWQPGQRLRVGDVTLTLSTIDSGRDTDDYAPTLTPSQLDAMPAEDVTQLSPAVADEREAFIRQHLALAPRDAQKIEIGEEVARGGMGAVLAAKESATRRTVALKVMLRNDQPKETLRFIEEAQVTAQLEHPNIVPVYDLGIDEKGQPFYTMKLVSGVTLKKVLDQMAQDKTEIVRKYPLGTLLTIFQKVCDALAFAHSKGVIHRDLKPANVMLGRYGEVMVMDWGLAKIIGTERVAPRPEPAPDESAIIKATIRGARREESNAFSTMVGSVMGTPHYMSPEQARGETDQVDARSDIFTLGIILYEILTLTRPFAARELSDILEKVMTVDYEPPLRRVQKPLPHLPGGRVPESLDAVVRKAMALDPADRYARVEQLQADLTAYQNGFATSAEQAGAWKQFKFYVARNRRVATAIAAGLALLAVSSSAFMWQVLRARDRAEAGERAAKHQASVAELSAEAAQLVNLAQTQPEDALLRAMVTVERSRELVGEVTPAVQYGLTTALEAHRLEARIPTSVDMAMLISWAEGPRRVALYGVNRSCEVLEVDSGNRVARTPQFGDLAVKQIALSDDARRVAAGGDSPKIGVWTIAPGREDGVATWDAHASWTRAVGFLPGNEEILSVGGNGEVRTWSLTGEKRPGAWQVSLPGGTLGECLLDAATHRLVATTDGVLAMDVFTVELGADGAKPRLTPLTGHTAKVSALALSPDARFVATGDADGTMRVWTFEGRLVGGPFQANRGMVEALAFSPDGNTIAARGSDRQATVFTHQGVPLHGPFIAEAQRTKALAQTSDARLLVGEGWRLNVFNLLGLESAPPIVTDNTLEDIIEAAGGSRLVALDGQGDLHIWDAATRERLVRRRVVEGRGQYVAESPDGKMLACSTRTGSEVRFVNFEGAPAGAPLRLETEEQCTSLAYAPDGRLVVGTTKGALIFHDPTGLMSTTRDSLDYPPEAGGLSVDIIAGKSRFMARAIAKQPQPSVRFLWFDWTGRKLSEVPVPADWHASFNASSRNGAVLPGDREAIQQAGRGVVRWRVEQGAPRPEELLRLDTVESGVQLMPLGGDAFGYSVSGGPLRVYTFAGQPLTPWLRRDKFHLDSIVPLADGRTFATGGGDRRMRFWSYGVDGWMESAARRLARSPRVSEPQTPVEKRAAALVTQINLRAPAPALPPAALARRTSPGATTDKLPPGYTALPNTPLAAIFPEKWQPADASGISLLNKLLSGLGYALAVGSSRVDLQACKLEYSIVSPK